MIGQKDLLNRINKQIEEEMFPRFAIFIGPEGMGKKTLMREIAKNWEYVIELEDVKVDTIRDMIDNAYKLTSPTVYIIPDAHKMHPNARNAILKVTEEPPNKAIFLMSVHSMEQTLETIKSRGTSYYMRPYTSDEKREYIDNRLDEQDSQFVIAVSTTMLDIDRLIQYEPGAFQVYVNKLIDNIASVTISNALKTLNMIDLRTEGKGYDLELLWRVCVYRWAEKAKEEPDNGVLYLALMSKTTSCMGMLKFSYNISKQGCYDAWVLGCRKIVEDYEDGHKHH